MHSNGGGCSSESIRAICKIIIQLAITGVFGPPSDFLRRSSPPYRCPKSTSALLIPKRTQPTSNDFALRVLVPFASSIPGTAGGERRGGERRLWAEGAGGPGYGSRFPKHKCPRPSTQSRAASAWPSGAFPTPLGEEPARAASPLASPGPRKQSRPHAGLGALRGLGPHRTFN